jgi:hypothetical protein
MKLRDASERVTKCEAELADKRKHLLLAGSGSSESPRASDERKRELTSAIERLGSSLPEMKRAVVTWEEVVATHKSARERAQHQLERLRQEYQEYTSHRDRETERIDTVYEAARTALEAQYAPVIEAIQADLHFFDILVERFGKALDPFRVDLVMDDASIRPYNEVMQQAYQALESKLAAVARWSAEVLNLIRQRREMVNQNVAEIDRAAIPNAALNQARLMLLPVWYVETVEGHFNLWPWQKPQPSQDARLIAPLVESSGGRRLALPEANLRFLEPMPLLQQRLDALLRSDRREQVKQDARRLGRSVPFRTELLNAIAIPAQMPRAMADMLLPLHMPPPPSPLIAARAASPVAATGDEARTGRLSHETGLLDSDEFELPDAVAEPPDAWQDDEAEQTSDGDDAWREEPEQARTAPLVAGIPTTTAGKHRANDGRPDDDDE